MKTNRFIKIFALCAAFVTSLASCVEEPQIAHAVLAEYTDMKFVAVDAEPQILPVYSDGIWTAECDAEWITIEPMTGNGNTDVTITVDNNAVNGIVGKARSAKIHLRGGSSAANQNHEVTINQKGDNYGSVPASTVTEAIAVANNEIVKMPSAQVVATNTKGVVLSDGTSNILVEGAFTVAIGDDVYVAGTRKSSNGVAAVSLIEYDINANGTVSYPDPVAINVDSYKPGVSEYITVSGLYVNGTLIVSGKTKGVEILFPSKEWGLNSLNIHKLVLTGYYAGVSGSNLQIVLTDLTDNGYDDTYVPDSGAEPIFFDDFSWLAPFIETYNAANPATPIGDTVGSGDKNANAPNAYTAAPFNTTEFAAAFAAHGYEDLNPGEKLIYPQDQYLKFSKTGGHNTAIRLSLANYAKKTEDLKLDFKFCMMVQGSGIVDEGPVTVLIEGDGEFTNGTKRSDDFISVQETDKFCWNNASTIIKGASANTKLIFINGRVINPEGTFNWAVSGAGRFFLDDVKLTPLTAEKTVIFKDDFSWMCPIVEAINQTAANPVSDFINGTYADMATRIDYSNNNSTNLYSVVGEPFVTALAEAGYTDLAPDKKVIYAQGTEDDAYLKFCKGNTQTGLSFKPFNMKYDAATIAIDWAAHMTKTVIDVVHLQFIIEGEGTFANGTKVSDPIETEQTSTTEPSSFTHSTVIVKNVDAETVIKLSCQEGFDANFAASGQHRYYIDNIEIYK